MTHQIGRFDITGIGLDLLGFHHSEDKDIDTGPVWSLISNPLKLGNAVNKDSSSLL
jgi:hypothetical protein